MSTLQKNNMTVMAGIAAGILVVLYLVNVGNQHGGRYGFPCYCKQCESDLIAQAANGDTAAQQKLAMSIDAGGAYSSGFSGNLGPFALVIGMVILVFIVSKFYGATQQYGQPLSGLFENKLRGR